MNEEAHAKAPRRQEELLGALVPLRELIYLVGLRGSGKSTAGRLLAERLGWRFVDADLVLEERAGCTIADLFAAEGEAGFRNREAAILRDLSTWRQHIIATGGGVVLRAENRQLLTASGFAIWLTGQPATLHRRLQVDPTTRDRRPALTSLPGQAELAQLLRERESLYREVAHLTVATDDQSPEAVVSTILSTWATSFSTCR